MAASELEERIAAIVQPLREELREIDRQIAAKDRELDALKESRRRVNSIIRQANGETKKPGPRGTAVAHPSESALEYVREFIRRDGTPEELIGSHVHRAIKADAEARGLSNRQYPGDGATRLALKEMHRNGELRLARKATGGAPVYVRI